ncbi:MAG TPA: YCF48-related protein, partial [Candidatus Eisenbacteria bacterium]|nr:YCF48-related protein [Candidatus Eisenbacteria bacterium]
CTGIYRSKDAGGRWTKLNGIPFSSRRTRSFALGREDHRVLLAGTTQGLWVSRDGGDSWRRATKKLVINAVVARPDGSILVGTEEEGVLRSKDGGESWITSNTGFSERFVSNLLFDPAGDRVLMAAWGARGGVYVGTNVGGPWTRLGEGLEDRQVLSLALLGRTILAGTDQGIHARLPDSDTWTPWALVVDGVETRARVTQIQALPSGGLVAGTSLGVLRSSDGGRTWSRPGVAEEVFGLAVSRRNPQVMVAATRSGFFRSRDGGGTWKQISKWIGATPHALAFMPPDDRVVFATTTRGLYRSKDQGSTWKRVGGGIPYSDLTGIVIHPQGRTIHVSDFTWGGIFRSTDGGSTWERMPTVGLGSERVWALTADPSAPDRLLAAASAGGLHLFLPHSPAPSARAATDLAPADQE